MKRFLQITISLLLLLSFNHLFGQTQMPLPGHSTTYTGNARGYWFTSPKDFTITGLRVALEAGGGLQNIQVVRFNNNNLTGCCTGPSFTQLVYISGATNGVVQSVNIQVNSGDVIGILGTAGATNSYGNGPFTTTIDGAPLDIYRCGYQGDISGGAAPSGQIWGEYTTGDVGRVEMYYTTTTFANDAGIFAITAPNSPFSPGSSNVKVSLKNFGTQNLTSANIKCAVNGVIKSSVYNWSGNLASRAMDVDIPICTHNFSLGVNRIVVWTENPNGVADSNSVNDSAEILVNCCQTSSGTYSIDLNGGGDFTSINQAVNSLNSCGVSGPVVFEIYPGVYNERVVIPEIIGASAVNTITFRAKVKDQVQIEFMGSMINDKSTIVLNGADYIRFEDINIVNTGTLSAIGVFLTDDANFNEIRNCKITVPVSSNTNFVGIQASGSENSPTTTGNSANYTIIDSCVIEGGNYNVVFYGTSTSSRCAGNKVTNCELTGGYNYGLYLYYQENLLIGNNSIHDMQNTSGNGYGIYCYYNVQNTYENNIIKPGRYGIFLGRENYYDDTKHSYCQNNMINEFNHETMQTGIRTYYGYHVHVLHNTVWVVGETNSYGNTACYIYRDNYAEIRNNIFISSGSSYVFTGYYPVSSVCDNNDYYYSGSDANYLYYPNTAHTSFTSFKNNYNATYFGVHDQNSYDNIDPKFVSKTDLHLSQGNKGLVGENLNLGYDIDNNPRCLIQGFLGADEPVWNQNVSDFTYEDTMCLNSQVLFFNTVNPDDPHRTEWFVNGIYESNDFNLMYTVKTAGYDTFCLRQSTCSNHDSVTKVIYFDSNTLIPKAEFMVNKNYVELGEEVVFNDLSQYCPAHWEWEISPQYVFDPQLNKQVKTHEFTNATDRLSQHISVKFLYPGEYSVSLVASKSSGKADTMLKANYINVLFSDNLSYMPKRSSRKAGVLYDNGGPDSNYSVHSVNEYIISPCSDRIELTFKQLSLDNLSFLRLYDGIDNKGMPLWNIQKYGMKGITGKMNEIGFDTILMATNSGMIYIEFESDRDDDAGFKLEWKAIGQKNYQAPVASFSCEDSICAVFDIDYLNTSFSDHSITKYYWDFDGNGSIDANTINASHRAKFSGVSAKYLTALIAENCGGIDTFVKEVVVVNPQTITDISIWADNNKPIVNHDIVVLSAIQGHLQCADEFEWEISPSGYYFENGTDKFSANPQVVFTSLSCYTVSLKVRNSITSASYKTIDSCLVKPKTYCKGHIGTLHQDVGISRVSIGEIDNYSSIGIQEYSNYSNTHSTVLNIAQTYSITIERNSTFNAMSRGVFIDWNSDGDFTDPGELVAFEDNASTLAWTTNITVPTNIHLVTTMMRITTNYGSFNSDPCGSSLFGEIEDYKIIISQDIVKPVITLNGSQTVYLEVGNSYNEAGATAIDNLEGNISHRISITNSVDTSKIGAYPVAYNVCDSVGNCADEVIRWVVITEDKTPPVITLIGNSPHIANVNIPFIDPGYQAWDNSLGDITDRVVVSGALDVYTIGEYELTYSVEDDQGYITTASRKIRVTDKAAPEIQLKGDNPMYVTIGDKYVEPGDTCYDNYWPSTKILHSVSGVVNTNVAGTYYITYRATDYSGNGPNVIKREVIVYDSSAPEITIYGGDVITTEVNEFYEDLGVIINDDDQNTSKFSILKYGTFYDEFPTSIPDKLGNYIIFYQVTDPSGNKSEILGRVVKVVDTEAPVVTLLGETFIRVFRWDGYSDAGYTLSDNYDDTASIKVVKKSNVNNATLPGVFTVSYQAEDLSGNKSPEVVRLVMVAEDPSSAIDDHAKTNLNVWPNPGYGTYTISVSDLTEIMDIIIMNELGQVLDAKILQQADNQIVVDITNQPSGLYYLKIQFIDKIELLPIIKR
jgi:hypothetical protein